MKETYHLRKVGSGSTSRGGSRTSFRGSRTSGIRSSRIRSGIRTSSFVTRYHNVRTGAVISRPIGWLWSRVRHNFLPVSRRYHYRSRPLYRRYTTPATSSQTYYYCTSDSNASLEIQCTTVHGDAKCCEDEKDKQVFCCGGKVDPDFVADFNQGTQMLARIFYTLSAMALFMHLFKRRFVR